MKHQHHLFHKGRCLEMRMVPAPSPLGVMSRNSGQKWCHFGDIKQQFLSLMNQDPLHKNFISPLLDSGLGDADGHVLNSRSHRCCTWCSYAPNNLHALTAYTLKASSKVYHQYIGQFRLYTYNNHSSNHFGGQEPGTPQCQPSGGENSVDCDNTASDKLIWIAGSRAWEKVSSHGVRFKHLIKKQWWACSPSM